MCLFDVDGTLTVPRGVVKQNMIDALKRLQEKVDVGIVGGSDLKKIEEQLGKEGKSLLIQSWTSSTTHFLRTA